jgi:hypothetical protein
MSASVSAIAANLETRTDRVSLEAQRAEFLDRLHRRSDDFEATRGLRLVSAALHRLPVRGPLVMESS